MSPETCRADLKRLINEKVVASCWLFTLLSNFRFGYSLRRITGTLREDLFAFMMISRRILLRMRSISDKICRRKFKTHFMLNIYIYIFLFSPENRAVREIMWKKIL